MLKARRCIVWFRQDLRMHDNEALDSAIGFADEVVPVYVFDERIFKGETSFGFPKTGVHRAQFIIEAVADLRASFQKLGINLVVRVGKPEEEIFKLAKEIESSWVFCNMERMDEERRVQAALEQKLWTVGQELRFFRGKMLYYTQDLPFPVAHTPEIFTTFRKEVERTVPVRQPLPAPTRMNAWTTRPSAGAMPTPATFGHDDNYKKHAKSVLPFEGGETAALEHLGHYFWGTDLIKTYKETRNGLLGADYSSKFSAALAQGCLSPKRIYDELKAYEAERGDNESTYWLFFELLWRDFFRLMGKKYGNAMFKETGLLGKKTKKYTDNRAKFEQWANGTTGVPFVDANMRELRATGFMSNRGRQNVASYLVNDLQVNWLMGAEWFESMLVDYDVCSNYGNWNYIAGVGNDPRDNRYFNIEKQARTYDPQGAYQDVWLRKTKV